MKLIAITSAEAGTNEIDYVKAVIDGGFRYVHIRKPNFSIDEMRLYLGSIPEKYLPNITLGSHISLADEFAVGGIHFKSTDSEPSEETFTRQLRKSKSCHSIDEVKQSCVWADYVFLSPIFDSISKYGYQSKFSENTLRQYASEGMLSKVVALGGIDDCNVSIIQDIGFGGAAFLGYLMQSPSLSELNRRINRIINNI